MDEKEIREAFEHWWTGDGMRAPEHAFDKVGGIYKYMATQSAWVTFQAACAWMMGKAEPVLWMIRTGHGDRYSTTEPQGIYAEHWTPLYAAPPMKNTEHEIVLPELMASSEFIAESMRQYARAAVELDRKSR